MTVGELTVGSRVRVKRGMFEGMTGTVIDVGRDGIVTVKLTAWGLPEVFRWHALEAL